jgi:hypothetical protein
VMDKYALPKEAWVETIFKRYMHLPDDVVNVFITSLPSEIDNAQDQNESLRGRGRKSAPYSYKLVREIDEKLNRTPGGKELVEKLRSAMSLVDNTAKERKLKQTVESVMGRPKYKENDLIISSFGRHPFELNRPSAQANMHMKERGPITETRHADDPEPQPEPAYRKWMG